MPEAVPRTLALTPQQWAELTRILREHAKGIEVRAFGSRAKGGARPFSDLDLALMTSHPLSLAQHAARPHFRQLIAPGSVRVQAAPQPPTPNT